MVKEHTDLRALAEEVERGLAALELPASPETLYAPVRYVLEGGGKRLRPALVLLSAEAFGGAGARQRALPAALAVEVFHNFTLVHDDIMDRAETRRGRPTVHTRWDEGTAILVGDVMIGMAYEAVLRSNLDRKLEILEAMSQGLIYVCECQSIDCELGRRV